MCVVGTLSVVLLLRIGRRDGDLPMGLLAGVLYATYPEAIAAERGVLLEPLVNALALAAVVLASSGANRAEPDGIRTWTRADGLRWLLAGFLLALAVTTKITAVAWLPGFAVLATGPSRRRLIWASLGVVIGALVFLVPSVLSDPRMFVRDVVLFQATRPPDGDPAFSYRFSSILQMAHLPMNVFAAIAVCGFAAVPSHRRVIYRVALLTTALTVAVLLASRGYWNQYNAQLAAPEALLAGFAYYPIARLRTAMGKFGAVGPVVTGVLLLLAVRSAYRTGRGQPPRDQIALVEAVRTTVPQGTCLLVFEPQWAILADRFPSTCPGERPLIDPYLVMLSDSVRGGERYTTTAQAFASDMAQISVRQEIAAARVVVMDARGEGQLNGDTKDLVSRTFSRVAHTAAGDIWFKQGDGAAVR
jgi:hypothetical protein